MAEIIIDSLEGGLSTLAPTAMLPNQCAYALNVEWFLSKCGERRNGSDNITLDGGTLAACDRIVWMHRHLPSSDETAAQLWVLGIDGSTPVMKYKTTSWNAVAISDTMAVDGTSEYQLDAVSIHGKLFICYNSDQDRLHVWDGSVLRRSGLKPPAAAPTASNSGSGDLEQIRYYRTRFTIQVGGITKYRSEPSAVLTHDPAGGTTVTITKPSTTSESETHWEQEASFDASSWFVIATTVVATTTVTDTTPDGSYATAGFDPTAGDDGDYTVIPSARLVAVDDDRLLPVGSFEDTNLDSRVMWTPPTRAAGVGNDERIELLTAPFVDLDNKEGGAISAISNDVNGYIYVTKRTAIYQGVRTTNRIRSYQFVALTKARGAEPGTLVEVVDNEGNPALFGIDRDVGPIRIGGTSNGAETCGQDLVEIWKTYRAGYLGSVQTVQKGVFYPKKKQIQWILPGSSNVLVLHPEKMRRDEDGGVRGGWAFWTTTVATYCNCLFSDNIDAGIARTLSLVPFTGREGTADGLIWRHDTGSTDNGTAYLSVIYTKQYIPGGLNQEANVKGVTLYGKARTNAALAFVSIHGLRANKVPLFKTKGPVSFTPLTGEEASFHYEHGHAIRHLDNIGVSELHTLWIGYGDTIASQSSAQWSIDRIVIDLDLEHKRG